MGNTTHFDEYTSKLAECNNKSDQLNIQKDFLLPIILDEKNAFVKAEYPRLQAAMGNEYHIGNESHIFHPLPETLPSDTPPLGNPNELTLAELALLPELEKCIPRMGTLSYMPLFRAHPTDSARLNLLANMYEKIAIGNLCTSKEVETLLKGHKEYMKFKTDDDDFVVIIKQ